MPSLFFGLIPLLVSPPLLTTDCDEFYRNRETGRSEAVMALECYASQEQTPYALVRQAYLEFFIAEFHSDEKKPLLLEAIRHSEEALLRFGPKYSIPEYMKRTPEERKVLAEALYTYGLSTARYIDIEGQWEAIKRMGDIKRSMDSLLRINEKETAFYGAHRTLGIFHTKVPEIAGGKIEFARKYLMTAIEATRHSGELSRYPANNIAYADLMHKLGETREGCHHLQLVADLSENDLRSLANGLYFESLAKVGEAKNLFAERKCKDAI